MIDLMRLRRQQAVELDDVCRERNRLRAALTEALDQWEAQATMDDIDGRIAELRKLVSP